MGSLLSSDERAWITLVSITEDGAGLNDDDDPSPEEVDATVGEAIEDELAGGPIVRVP